MPISVRHTPFGSTPPTPTLRTPQARVLATLMPQRDGSPVGEWPTYNRAVLARRAGYTAISGSITRALNGIRPGSSSDKRNDKPGEGHLGLLAMGLVEEFPMDIDGLVEVCYRATPAGVRAFRAHEAAVGDLPAIRDRESCINDRYKK